MSQPFPTSCTNDDRLLPRCQQCGRPEHGSAACDTTYEEQQWEPFCDVYWPKGIRLRVIDDELFIVDPGSPPINQDELTRNL